MENKRTSAIYIIILLLVVGVGLAYWIIYGGDTSENLDEASLLEAISDANPFKADNTNPFDQSSNPYENIKVNPFE